MRHLRICLFLVGPIYGTGGIGLTLQGQHKIHGSKTSIYVHQMPISCAWGNAQRTHQNNQGGDFMCESPRTSCQSRQRPTRSASLITTKRKGCRLQELGASVASATARSRTSIGGMLFETKERTDLRSATNWAKPAYKASELLETAA